MRDPIPGNIIPASRLDAVGVKFASYLPRPNQAGLACSGANNFFGQQSYRVDNDQFDAKVDWAATDKDRMFVSLNWRSLFEKAPNFYGTIGDPTYANSGQTQPSGGIRYDYTRIQTPSLLLNFKLSVNRVEQDLPPIQEGLKLTDFGFPASLEKTAVSPYTVPTASITGYGPIGTFPFSYLAVTSYNSKASASWSRGAHTMRFGYEMRIMQAYEFTGFDTSGSFSFGRNYTQAPTRISCAPMWAMVWPQCCWAWEAATCRSCPVSSHRAATTVFTSRTTGR